MTTMFRYKFDTRGILQSRVHLCNWRTLEQWLAIVWHYTLDLARAEKGCCMDHRVRSYGSEELFGVRSYGSVEAGSVEAGGVEAGGVEAGGAESGSVE